MVNLYYDGSWQGLLTLVFESFEFKWEIASILKGDNPAQESLFALSKQVVTHAQKAERVWNGLKKVIGSPALRNLYCVFLSEWPQIEMDIVRAIHFYFSGLYRPEYAYGHPSVLRIKQVAKMVDREKHRMKAFVRFHRAKDDLYWAVVEPDFNVLPLIASHFQLRYADQKWLIYDVKRAYGLFYDLHSVKEVTIELDAGHLQNERLHEDEVHFQSLWKSYFANVNIKERKNTKLHVRELPRRYWKYLTEKQEWK